jgi:PEP-CTERM motif
MNRHDRKPVRDKRDEREHEPRRSPEQGLYFLSGAESFGNSQPVTISAAAVPEPGTMLISGLGLAGLCLLRRKRSGGQG